MQLDKQEQRLTGMSKFGLSCRGVYDLRTKWNLSDVKQRNECFHEITALDPTLIIGAPMCGPDSALHNLNPKGCPEHLVKEAVEQNI